ncbi:DUF6152 family protein [Paracoccus sp. S1E-3]|uniref:DUF6152 family protein n=1 Tax=Paracoccus sp. S1E-3 TaxID=2756130 RepID=UPI0015EFD174|nr:DUF6152 family protein [Paracoccus sp. S1E-3]MBA4490871.1 hypothetical protein [Paracoccus sp. S1E-3]
MQPIRRLVAASVLLSALSLPALAHHGWGWAEGDLIQMTGAIRSVTIAPPHPILEVEAADGNLWTVELGNPGRTERAGFVEGVAEAGDQVEILGNRSRDRGEARMKAVSITLDGRDYVFYPERLPEN